MPPVAILAATAAAQMGSQAIANSAAGSDEEKAMAARQAALNQILGIDVPTVDQQKIALQHQQVAGNLNPNMEGTVTMDPSAMEGISTDPRLRDAQMKALETMQGLGNTGLSAADRVALMDIRNKAIGDSRADQETILQNLAQRGMAGGGQELAARMMASQNASNIASREGMDVAAQAQQNALQALMNSGTMGGQLRSQEFGEKSDVARAQDAISQFNAANRQNVSSRNVGAQNAAQEYNLSNLQNVMNTNVGLNNAQEQYNKELSQRKYENELNKAKAAAGQQEGVASQYNAQAQGTRQLGAGIASGIGTIGGGFANAAAAPAKKPFVGPPKPDGSY